MSTRPGFSPVQRPVHPDSATISRAVSVKEGLLSFHSASFSPGRILGLAGGSHSCCRVAITETGIVKIWASAPAIAPSKSSVLVDNETRLDEGVRRARYVFLRKV